MHSPDGRDKLHRTKLNLHAQNWTKSYEEVQNKIIKSKPNPNPSKIPKCGRIISKAKSIFIAASLLQVFVIYSASHTKTNKCLIFHLVPNILCREDTLSTCLVHTKVNIKVKRSTRDRDPMAREPDAALLMTASGSLDIFLSRLLRKKLFL